MVNRGKKRLVKESNRVSRCLAVSNSTASGMAWSLMVVSVMSPSVPSDPANRLVKL